MALVISVAYMYLGHNIVETSSYGPLQSRCQHHKALMMIFCIFQFGFRFPGQDIGRSFNQTYRCYPVAMLDGGREDVERGGKSM